MEQRLVGGPKNTAEEGEPGTVRVAVPLVPVTLRRMTPDTVPASPVPGSRWQRALDILERAGNKLPDPVLIFVFALGLVWIASALLAPVHFSEADPRTVKRDAAGR